MDSKIYDGTSVIKVHFLFIRKTGYVNESVERSLSSLIFSFSDHPGGCLHAAFWMRKEHGEVPHGGF